MSFSLQKATSITTLFFHSVNAPFGRSFGRSSARFSRFALPFLFLASLREKWGRYFLTRARGFFPSCSVIKKRVCLAYSHFLMAEDTGLEPAGLLHLTRFPGELLSHSVNPPQYLFTLVCIDF